ATPRLKEKVGQSLHEGDLIGVVEARAALELEIALAEQDVARVRPGQAIRLKARALPYETFTTVVDRVAASGVRGEAQSSVTVYGRLDQAPDDLRTEMTGYARIDTGRRPIGAILVDRMLRVVRTEFWWYELCQITWPNSRLSLRERSPFRGAKGNSYLGPAPLEKEHALATASRRRPERLGTGERASDPGRPGIPGTRLLGESLAGRWDRGPGRLARLP